MFVVTLGDIVGLSILAALVIVGMGYVVTMYARAKWRQRRAHDRIKP